MRSRENTKHFVSKESVGTFLLQGVLRTLAAKSSVIRNDSASMACTAAGMSWTTSVQHAN